MAPTTPTIRAELLALMYSAGYVVVVVVVVVVVSAILEENGCLLWLMVEFGWEVKQSLCSTRARKTRNGNRCCCCCCCCYSSDSISLGRDDKT